MMNPSIPRAIGACVVFPDSGELVPTLFVVYERVWGTATAKIIQWRPPKGPVTLNPKV